MEALAAVVPQDAHSPFAHDQSSPQSNRRRKRHPAASGVVRGTEGRNLRICPHCGRTFKRTEHLERHVRTHTKEKPFVCGCGAAFARRDLLTRHRRLSLHEDAVSLDGSPTAETQAAEADLAAAVSLSGLSADPWPAQQLGTIAVPIDHRRSGRQARGQTVYAPELISSEIFGTGTPAASQDIGYPLLDEGIGFDPHFREFANFLDGVGLPAEWSPYFNGPDRGDENEIVDPALEHSDAESPSPRLRQRQGTPFSSWLPSAPTGNRISANASESSHPGPADQINHQFKVTDEQRSKLNASVESLADILDPAFRLPSRHALTRYITSWFEGFHSHMPFIHCRTWHVFNHSLELILSISAVGAQYCFEHRSSRRLFKAAKTILMERLARIPESLGPRTSAHLALNSQSRQLLQREPVPWEPIETVRALIALMGYATWEPETTMVREAFALQGLLSQVLRDIGLEEDENIEFAPTYPSTDPQAAHAEWIDWIDRESRRRSKIIAFSFLHTHSIAYNVYPVLRSNEIRLRLPCSTKEWKAATAIQWQIATREVKKQQLHYQDALSLLLRHTNESAPLDPIPTPLGNYVLLHGLLQRIHIVRELSLPVMTDSAALPAEEVDKLEWGLRSWTSGWQQASESSLDPNNENGPIPFTSSSLLALAYVRIHLHLGPYRKLDTRDPMAIATALGRSPRVERSDGVIAALLYSVHMLSIPVRLGVDRVARSQAFFWSVRHSLSSLECGILLSKWLRTLGDTMNDTPLTDSEDRILHWVRSIVEEAYSVVDFNDSDDSPDLKDLHRLGLYVLKIWEHFFKSNTQWPFINMIGESLEHYCEIFARARHP